MKGLALAFLVVLLTARPIVAAESGKVATEVVKMGDLPAISSAGLYVAMEKGFFAEKNITVETERFASGGKMTPALATGQIDVATGTASAGLFNSIASGQDFTIVADEGQCRPGYSVNPLIVRKDLVDSGKVKRVEVVNLAYRDAIKVLATEAVDAVIAPEPWAVRAEEQKVGVKMFFTHDVPDIASFQIAVIIYLTFLQ